MLEWVTDDIANAFFECGGAFLQTLSIRRLLKDKKLEGVSLLPSSFITLWGMWNVHYYDALHQNYSLVAGALLCLMNAVWLTLAVYYSRKHLCEHI